MRLISVTALLLSVGLAYTASFGGPPGTDNCNQPQFNACNANLGTYWGVDTTNAWKSLSFLSSEVDSLIRPPYNIYNYVNVCNGFSQFYSCLGQFNIRNCLGTIGFVGSGMSPQDAYTYEGYLAAWRFKCGGGFFMVYENDGLTQCTQSTHINSAQDMNKYITSYVASVQNDPNNACVYAQKVMDQIGGVYQQGCLAVDKEKGRIYGCQSMREYTNAQFSHCRHITTCKKSSSATNFISEISEGAEVVLPENFEKQGEDWIKVAAKNI